MSDCDYTHWVCGLHESTDYTSKQVDPQNSYRINWNDYGFTDHVTCRLVGRIWIVKIDLSIITSSVWVEYIFDTIDISHDS